MENQVSFQYVQPTEEQKATMQKYRDAYEVLAQLVYDLPGSRGRSLALTKLEESAFWVNKSITHNE